MEGERFSLAKPTQSHVEDYNIAAAEFAEHLRNFIRWLRLIWPNWRKIWRLRVRLGLRGGCRSGAKSRVA